MTSPSPAALARELSNPEKRVLLALRRTKALPLGQLVAAASFSGETEAMSAASWLRAKGLCEIEENVVPLIGLGEEGRRYAATGLPERRLFRFLEQHGGRAELSRLGEAKDFTNDEVQIALTWWKRKGFGELSRVGKEIQVQAGTEPAPTPDERALEQLRDGALRPESDVTPEGLRLLKSRRGVLRTAQRKDRAIRLSALGAQVAALPLSVEEAVSQLTPDLIKSGAWRDRPLRPYDLATPAPRPGVAKPHPLVQLIEEIRDIFRELGFEEIEEEFVVSTFWNMDALFIPQDHPAREMQDTLYLERPKTLPVEKAIVAKIAKVHEDGGGTGSRGWGGRFDPDESARALLRTHTTVGTIRHLARHPEGPLRIFSIGRVFRKETMDATHLPEFHQIEGIATEKGADFPLLLGILQEFYRRLGFQRLRWRPAYFPYTEPSMEVEVWTGTRWMELGGCGIFRPEVTLPFGVKTPVLAWGLGLERLAMLRFGLKDIRDLYFPDLEWLRSQPLL